MPASVKQDESTNPVDVGLLRSDTEAVLAGRAPNGLHQPERFGRIGRGVQMRLRDEWSHDQISSRIVEAHRRSYARVGKLFPPLRGQRLQRDPGANEDRPPP